MIPAYPFLHYPCILSLPVHTSVSSTFIIMSGSGAFLSAMNNCLFNTPAFFLVSFCLIFSFRLLLPMTSVRISPSEMEDRGWSQIPTSEEESKCDLNINT